MRRRKNTAPPLGPDLCKAEDCGALAQTSLTASGDTLRALGYAPVEGEPLTLRVCVKCYLRAMAEVQARAKRPAAPSSFTSPPTLGKVLGEAKR